jgi:hypothetical protein
MQLFFNLAQLVTTDKAHSLVCIPDRDTAECELTRLRHEYGPRLLKAVIRKDRPPKCNPKAKTTYTLRYFTKETYTVNLF